MAWSLFVLIVLGAAASIVLDRSGPDQETAPGQGAAPAADAPTTTSASGEGDPRSFTIAATGDLIVHESVADAARTSNGWDFTSMFSSVAATLSAADLAVCHVETPMALTHSRLSYYPAFHVPRELASAIASAGYDTCSLASNHATDAGRDGVVGTISALATAGVAHAGMARSAQERGQISLIEVNAATVAHLSYTYGFNNGELPEEDAYLSNVIDEAQILDEARRARSAGADFVLLSMHWGTNYETAPDDYQTDLGPRLLASPDIDLIIGHHAHVVQPVAEIGGEYLLYGLGNFLSNQSPETCTGCPPGTEDGVIVHLTVTEDEATDRWSVTAISHTPTLVDRSNFEIVEVLGDGGGRDPAALAQSAARTAAAVGAIGTAVPSSNPSE